jgi:hypothetical protein
MEAVDALRVALLSTRFDIDPESLTRELFEMNEARGVFDEPWIDPQERERLNRALRLDFEREAR